MTLRHAAALALVGWVLMFPPDGEPRGNFRTDASLFEWMPEPKAYKSKAECERAAEQARKDAQADADKCWNFNCAIQVARNKYGRCVASDDPRLKEK